MSVPNAAALLGLFRRQGFVFGPLAQFLRFAAQPFRLLRQRGKLICKCVKKSIHLPNVIADKRTAEFFVNDFVAIHKQLSNSQ